MIDEDWAYIAEKDGEAIGAALTLPDVNQVLAKLKGRLFPLGWAKFLLGKGKVDRLRVFALGVKSDYRHTGVAAGLYLEHLETAQKPGAIEGGEMGWILETNEPMNRAMEGMGGASSSGTGFTSGPCRDAGWDSPARTAGRLGESTRCPRQSPQFAVSMGKRPGAPLESNG